MTKKSWISSMKESGSASPPLSATASNSAQESLPGLNKANSSASLLPTRTTSSKLLLAPLEEKAPAIMGKFSEAKPLVPAEKAPEESSVAKPKALLLRAESSGALRRGTPRPTDLKKTMSTIKFVLEESGLDQVAEEDYDMA